MQDLRKELHKAFDESKKQLKFKSSFEDLEEIFFLYDMVESEGYVSARFSRSLCRRIGNLYWNWNNYLHNLVVPNPNSMVMVAESQMVDETRRADILNLMNQIVAHAARNSMISLEQNNAAEAKFIDESVSLWTAIMQPKLMEIMTHIATEWAAKAKEPVHIEEDHRHP